MKTFSRPGTLARTYPHTSLRPLALAIALLFAPPVLALPTGGQVGSGQASIGVPTNGLMTINQSSQKAILNWQGFSIGVGEATHFQQPVGGVALNRVVSGNPSQILGSLSSTGQIFLVNPSGILFGNGAVLNVGGLVASTLDISNTDFLDGNLRFFSAGNSGSLINQGELNASEGGYIALLAPEVRNEGVISAWLGSVAIGSGNRIALDLAGDGLINLSIEESALNGRIENKQAIHADGGQVILSARAANSLAESVINNEGVIRANSVSQRNGRIVLESAHFIAHSGSLEANGDAGVNAGSIRLAADNILLAGDASASGRQGGNIDIRAGGNLIQTAGSVVDASGHDGLGGRVTLQASNADADTQVFLSGATRADGLMGGQVQILGDRVTLAAANVSATGTAMGGEILIGGGFQGAATGVPNARKTAVNAASSLNASATDMGAGGRVVVWSDGDTAFAGSALARGGKQGGDGGLVEISGKESLLFDGMANAGGGAAFGRNGRFLLDPKNITISATAMSSAGYFDLADPTPAAGDQHGSTTQVFGTDKLLVLSPNDDNAASDAGAIYVYDTLTGAMLSMLTGDQASDRVGSGGITTLSNSGGADYLIKSPLWHGSAGAVTWLDSAGNGITGVVGASNSLVGSSAGDAVGTYIATIFNGGTYDYVVISPDWGGGKGAATFAHGDTGVTGAINSANSLVGTQAGDKVGSNGSSSGLTSLSSGHYVIRSKDWNGGAGAVTFMNRASGVTGEVSAANSLVGGSASDQVGSGGVQSIWDNGAYNYLVLSSDWNSQRGAVTFGSGSTGVSGEVSATNSYVGDTAGDRIGSEGITTLSNSGGYAYLIKSPSWHASTGAITWFDGGGTGFGGGAFGGIVGDGNSLVGAAAGDAIGSGGVVTMNVSGVNNYYVVSPEWNGQRGAMTFGSGASGVAGITGESNSLVGGHSGDRVGSGGLQQLLFEGYNPTGIYIATSPEWNGGAGAVTFIDKAVAMTGLIGAGNSLVGNLSSDQVGSDGVEAIRHISGVYNYLIFSPNWGEGRGAVTFGSGASGVKGEVSGVASEAIPYVNSFVGTVSDFPQEGITGDRVGSAGLTTLQNSAGYAYLIKSPLWGEEAGAVTWFSGNGTGIEGAPFGGEVGPGNSLVGSHPYDQVGGGWIEPILDTNGVYNYLVLSPDWGGSRGAVTFGSGASGVKGYVSGVASEATPYVNSFVGTVPFSEGITGDRVGSDGISTWLSNTGGYAYLISSPDWQGGRGAVTWFDGGGTKFGNTAFGGVIDETNSLVGANAGDRLGSGGIYTFGHGAATNYLIRSPDWGDGRGAVTFGKGDVGVIGVVSSGNSLVGTQSGDRVGDWDYDYLEDLYGANDDDFLVMFTPEWDGGKGAVTPIDMSLGLAGEISHLNSLVGGLGGDRAGSGSIEDVGDYFVLLNPEWRSNTGAVTKFHGADDLVGVVGAGNSLVGSVAGDRIGYDGIHSFYDDVDDQTNFVVLSPDWNNDVGAVTFVKQSDVLAGVVGSNNSLIGDQIGDRVGSGGVDLIGDYDGNSNRLILSPNWHAGAGAVTFLDRSVGVKGILSVGNSLVGSVSGDGVGSGGIEYIYDGVTDNYNYVVLSPDWGGGKGAASFGSNAAGIRGEIGSTNSFIGTQVGDRVGSHGIEELYEYSSGMRTYLLLSRNWHENRGALTWFTANGTGIGGGAFGGEIGASNSLVGTYAEDQLGSNGIDVIYGGSYTDPTRFLVYSPNWNGGRGAVTLGRVDAGLIGEISADNSFIGDQVGDQIGSSNNVTWLYSGNRYNYLFSSPQWHAGAGAVTWFAGDGSGFGGVVGADNSLVGANAGDGVGSGGVSTYNASGGESSMYSYLVYSPNWDGSKGAVTWGNGATGVKGVVGAANSLVGSQAGDTVGSNGVTSLGSLNYLLRSPNWSGSRGALTYFNIAEGLSPGVLTSGNSFVGEQVGDLNSFSTTSLATGQYLLKLPAWGGNAGRLLVLSAGGGYSDSGWGYGDAPGDGITIHPNAIAAIANNGTDVILAANNDITLAANTSLVIDSANGVGGDLIFRAGRSIYLNGNIDSDGNVYLYANDTAANGVLADYRDSGLAQVAMAAGTSLISDGKTGIYMLEGLGAGTAGDITLATLKAADIDFLGNVLVTYDGLLRGSGLIDGDLDVVNATFAPGQSPGEVIIKGDLTLGQGSIMQIEYGGMEDGDYDTVAVSGTTVLGGVLELLSYDGFTTSSKLDVKFLPGTGAVSGKFASVRGPLAGFVPVPGDEAPIDDFQSTLQEALETPVSFVQLEVVDTDQSLQTLLEQAVEGEVVGATEQIQAAATQIAEKRETRLQTFSQAISELRINAAAADVVECAAGQGGGSGACLVTRKQKDLDGLIADAPADTRKRIALLIGNDSYTGDIPALSTPISDVEAIAAKLKHKHGFEVIVLRNAGKVDIIREMNRLATSTEVADSVMVMYAGHGYQEGAQGMGYWIPVDATATSASGWVSNQDISKLLFAIPARQVMLVSDSCFSGSLTREQRVKAVKGLKREDVFKQRSVLVLSSGGEEPVTDAGHDGHSIFAWNLLKVLDSAESGITGFEVYRQVHEGVVREFPQQPQYGASIFAGHKGEGDFYLTD